MAGAQDLFDPIVMADDRWVPALPGPRSAAGLRCGSGLVSAGLGGPRRSAVALKAADTWGADTLLIVLYSAAAGRGGATCPAAPRTRLPAPGRRKHLLGPPAALLQERPVLAGTDLCHLGTAPFPCSSVAGHTAAFMDMLINVSDVTPFPPEPPGRPGAGTRGSCDKGEP